MSQILREDIAPGLFAMATKLDGLEAWDAMVVYDPKAWRQIHYGYLSIVGTEKGLKYGSLGQYQLKSTAIQAARNFAHDSMGPVERSNPGQPLNDRLHMDAVKHYGITHSPELAGFVMADGSLLDFSEGSGERCQDHRNVEFLLPAKKRLDDATHSNARTKNMVTFMRETGAIRCHFSRGGAPFLHLAAKPTNAQLRAVASAIREVGIDWLEIDLDGAQKPYQVEPVTPGRVRMVLEAISEKRGGGLELDLDGLEE